jgi:hypothetical protein
LTQEIGYSEGSAQRRIDAARLIQLVPEVGQKIEAGILNLSQTSKLQNACRSFKKENGESVSLIKKQQILEKLQRPENKGTKNTDLILAQELNFKPKFESIEKIQKDESIRIEMTFSKEEMEILNQVKTRMSHKTGGSLKETLMILAKKQLQEKSDHGTDNIATATAKMAEILKNGNSEKSDDNKPTKTNKTITPKMRAKLLHENASCEFKDKNSGKVCGSKFFLEIDHLHPRFAGGTNSWSNLRVLCSQHNIFRYRQNL